MRLFVAIPLTPVLRENITQAQAALRLQIAERTVKWVAPANVHLTLQFLGEVAPEYQSEIAAALRAACVETAPFALRTGAIGCFPNARRPRVIYLALNGDLDELNSLQSRIASALAPFSAHLDNKPFTPHLTLARVKTLNKRTLQTIGRAVENVKPNQADWPMQQVELVHSHLTPQGPIYTVLARVKL